MSTRIQIDPEGEVLIILPVKKSVAKPEFPQSPAPPVEKHFLCSKKHLIFASPRAARIFSSSFKEASEEDDGFHHWRFEAIFDADAFGLVLRIIHGKTRQVPQVVELDTLAAVASIADDLLCYDALHYFGHRWIQNLYGTFTSPLPKAVNKTLVQFLLISSVFEHRRLFEDSTRTAIQFSGGTIPTFELPIRADILSHIEKRRIATLTNLVYGLTDLENRLLTEQLGCSYGCRSMLLGTLMQGMRAAGLYSMRRLPPFSTLTLDSVIKSLRNTQSPAYFTKEENSVIGNHSGRWALVTRSNATQPDNASRASVSSSLFGAHPDTHTPKPPTSGLFTGISFNTASSSLDVTETDNNPTSLVRHHCSLKDLLDPLLNNVEAGIKGLNLADYPRP